MFFATLVQAVMCKSTCSEARSQQLSQTAATLNLKDKSSPHLLARCSCVGGGSSFNSAF